MPPSLSVRQPNLPEEPVLELARLKRQNAALQNRLDAAERARAAAEQKGAGKTRLLAFATPDLKSPLSALHTTCGFLIDSADDPDEVRALARLMQTEIGRMTRLVHDFLDRSALDSGALRIERQSVDLAEIARRIVAELEVAARFKDQTLHIEPTPPDLPLVHGDPDRLAQILANLVDNAVKYTPRGGRVTLRLDHDRSLVRCAVEDTGPGFAPEDIGRLFLPYERLSARPARGESSHGLGLALALELTTLHGGTLLADSPASGGARFTLSLPVGA